MQLLQAINLLNLPEKFNLLELKSAYRKAALKHHPDCGGKQENFIKIDKAYDLLKSYAVDYKTFNESIYWAAKDTRLKDIFATNWKKAVKQSKKESNGMWFSTCIERFARSYAYPRKAWFEGLILGSKPSEKKKRDFQEKLKAIAPNQRLKEEWALKYYRLELGESSQYVFYLSPAKTLPLAKCG
jgi:DnaJ-class molecular chaperone